MPLALPRRMAIVVFPGVQILNVAGPMEMWRGAGALLREKGALAGGSHPYEVRLVAHSRGPVAASCGLEILPHATFFDAGEPIDTLVAAGGLVENALADESLVAFVRSASASARRVIALGAGTFVLAQAGLLEGCRATTHWRHCEDLARRFPGVRVEADRVFVRDGNRYTCAGITAALDLALALVQEDFGKDIALGVARDKVLHLKRPGDELQISAQLMAQSMENPRLDAVLRWILESPREAGSVEAIADRMAVSSRSLARIFRQELGTSPAKFVERTRVEIARRLLEESDLRIEAIARRSGFPSEERLRVAFHRHFGTSPRSYQARFGEARVPPMAGYAEPVPQGPLDAIRGRVRARLAEIGAELRSYPGPISRCDAQLGGLLEERAALQAALEHLN